MADELIDLLDENDLPTGKSISKYESHSQELWHLTINAMIFTPKGEVLIQKRVGGHKVYPNTWDLSVGGHVGFGHSPIDVVIKEAKEEVGIDLVKDNIKFICISKDSLDFVNNSKHNEVCHVFICKLDKIPTVKLLDGEVSETKIILLSELENDLLDKEKSKNYLPHKHWPQIIEALKKELN